MTKNWNRNSSRAALALIAISLAGALGAVAPAAATPNYDGLWSVVIVTEKGTCDRAYRYPVRIANGALVNDGKRQPWGQGTLVYLDAGRDLDGCIARVVGAGGKVAVPKTEIGEHGSFAIVVDTEGNAVGLHAPRAS